MSSLDSTRFYFQPFREQICLWKATKFLYSSPKGSLRKIELFPTLKIDCWGRNQPGQSFQKWHFSAIPLKRCGFTDEKVLTMPSTWCMGFRPANLMAKSLSTHKIVGFHLFQFWLQMNGKREPDKLTKINFSSAGQLWKTYQRISILKCKCR